jgi:hypothetical protein
VKFRGTKWLNGPSKPPELRLEYIPGKSFNGIPYGTLTVVQRVQIPYQL